MHFKDPELENRLIAVIHRLAWFEDNMWDIRRHAFSKDLAKFTVLFDLYERRIQLDEKSIPKLEAALSFLEKKYKPEDAYLFE